MREACDELASDFACEFPLLPEEVELDFSSSRFARVPVDGLTGSAASSLALSPRLQRLLSRAAPNLPVEHSQDLFLDFSKRKASLLCARLQGLEIMPDFAQPFRCIALQP